MGNGSRPFIVTAGSKICFIGAFSESVVSSMIGAISIPRILDADVQFSPNNVVCIVSGYEASPDFIDTRYNNDLIAALKHDSY